MFKTYRRLNQFLIGSDIGLSPVRRLATVLRNVRLLLNERLSKHFRKIRIEKQPIFIQSDWCQNRICKKILPFFTLSYGVKICQFH